MPGNHLFHRRIDTSCPQTAAKGQNAKTVIKAKCTTCFFLGLLQNIAAHRKSCYRIRAGRRHILQGFLHGQHHMGNFLCQHFIGNARIGILLMNGTGNPHFGCHSNDRASSNGNIRLKAPNDFLRTLSRAHEIRQCLGIALDIFQSQLALKPCHLNRLQAVSGLRHQSCLHTVRGSCKQKFRIGIMLSNNGCNCQRRVDVPAGSASCK